MSQRLDDPRSLPAEAYGAALAALPGVGPGRLAALLRNRTAPEAWDTLVTGDVLADPAVVEACGAKAERLAELWLEAVLRTSVNAAWDAIQSAGISVALHGTDRYPSALAADEGAPAVVFWVGDTSALDHRRVTVVGTRACTPAGAEIARELGRDLADAGVAVVSGLALGIDGAAHRGAVDAARSGGTGPVGVVARGVDVPYPRRHAGLWRDVAETGLLLSETPPGLPPDTWRFPARNRILAALAEVVVVVESHAGGGSMLTVDEALARGVEVMAVPGSVRNPAATGSNNLLADGSAPVRSAADVLDWLGLQHQVALPAAVVRRGLASSERQVLDAVEWSPTTTARIIAATSIGPVEVARCLHRLEEADLVRRGPGWWERRSPPRMR